MKFRLLLWALGFMMKRSSRKSEVFKKTLSGKDLTFQLSSVDGISRHFIVVNNTVRSIAGNISEPTFELSFSSAAKGFEILTAKNSQLAFMQGIQDKDIQVSGDLNQVLWFQSMAKALRK